MSAIRQAIGLIDDFADAGVRIGLNPQGKLQTQGIVPEALGARLKALVGSGDQRAGQPLHRALMAALRAPDRACREVLCLPVGFARLPVGYAVQFVRKSKRAQLVTSGKLFERDRGQLPQFVLRELDAMALALLQGAGPVHLDRWLEAKSRGDWLLTPELAGARVDATEPADVARVEFGALLDGYGAALVGVELAEVAA